MISLEQIRAEQLASAAKAAKANEKPVQLWPMDLVSQAAMRSFCKSIPFLGDYIPKGYQHINVRDKLNYHLDYFFVDATGAWENTYHESALSMGEFRDMLLELLRIDNLENPIGLNGRYDVSSSYSLGIWEAGQFQVKIALYQERGK